MRFCAITFRKRVGISSSFSAFLQVDGSGSALPSRTPSSGSTRLSSLLWQCSSHSGRASRNSIFFIRGEASSLRASSCSSSGPSRSARRLRASRSSMKWFFPFSFCSAAARKAWRMPSPRFRRAASSRWTRFGRSTAAISRNG